MSGFFSLNRGKRLRITNPEETKGRARIELDGVDISDAVDRLALIMIAGEVTRCAIEFFPSRVDVDLKALVEADQEPRE